MKKTLSLLYGAGAYIFFLAVFLYLVAFEMNLVPNSVSSLATASPWLAGLVDIGLVTAFGLQHSVMARQGFKNWWTRIVPRHLERSTFVWIGAAMILLIVLGWQPIEGNLWTVTGSPAIAILAVSALGWSMVPVCSFLTDHFELFGLLQVWEYATGRSPAEPHFKTVALYKQVRHPMMLGFIVALWATPHMTIGHLVFAGTMSAYILVGIYFEERDLVRKHGASYRHYQLEVPKLIPGFARSGAAQLGMTVNSKRA